ncbi:DEAD/DEAH box helicase [Loa loa]|uniref:RNA helicase n=1 Tax=Loa loa TaxID=7209 RepID=A0A1I7VQE0_LOALO|nr:DEAD/DEAH box helicase [Loa loa]EFO27871.2 DEAD/DEAH box helicase [Loa loa]
MVTRKKEVMERDKVGETAISEHEEGGEHDPIKKTASNKSEEVVRSSMKKHERKKTKKSTNRPSPCFESAERAVNLESVMTFKDFGLDEQLLKVIGELGWERPTLIQSRMIPAAFENKNILARARTGSGKTAAFMLPIIQRVLQLKCNSSSNGDAGPFAVFIVPTKELAKQTYSLLCRLTEKFPFLMSLNFSELNINTDDNWLLKKPDFVVSTPSRFLQALSKYGKPCESVKHVVLDEADLLLSFGYSEEMRLIKNFLPTHHQTIFTSATMTEKVEALKELYVTGPIILMKLKEGQLPNSDQLSQYHISCQNEEERFAIFLALLKLKLIIGKSIIFVRDTDRCYQLGLFLQAFNIRSCILNAQMPVNSRCHVVEQFNEGRYSYVIASDINDVSCDSQAVMKDEDDGNVSRKERIRKKKQKHIDRESGVSRGIDFHHVANVINFDFPTSLNSYIHRVGRTARGWNKGNALSFVSPQEKPFLEEVQDEINAQLGHRAITPYEVRIKELESFFLRAREVLVACTKTAIREARLAEIRAEVLRSKRLEAYFAKNPRERAALEHDKKLFSVNLHSPAIADVPDYMVPLSLRGINYRSESQKKEGKRKRKKQMHPTVHQIKYQKKKEDPLQSFSFL